MTTRSSARVIRQPMAPAHLTYKQYQVYDDFPNNLRMSNPSTQLMPKTSVIAEIKDVGLLHLVGLLVMAPLTMTQTTTTTTTTP